MKAAAVSKLKATLSEYIALVKGGEEILVTERGKPVARISPIRGLPKTDIRRIEQARRGILRPGAGRISTDLLRRLPVVKVSEVAVRRVMEEEREDTR